MTYIYDKSGQRIFFQREGSTYGKAYDPETELTAFTAVPADYPHWRRLDIIEDTFDIPVPFIEKIKKFDIQDLKHPSAILSGNIEATEITFDMTAQALEFLPLAVGTPAVTSHKQAMVQTVTCPAESGNIVQGDYFLLDSINGSGDVEHFAVWADTAGNGTTGKPSITGVNAANVLAADISGSTPTSTATQIATAVAAIINADADFGATSSAAVVTITNANDGAVQQAHDSGVAPMVVECRVTTWGSTDYGIVEVLTTALPSFTIHVEQQNITSAEDLVYDLFGCVVESITVNLTYGDKLGMCSVVLRCPYGLTGNKNTNNPPRKYIKGFPAMSAMQESADNYLLQEKDAYGDSTYVHADRTPKTVDSVILSITNNATFKSDISKRYGILAVAGKREITLQIVGNTDEKELFQYFLEEFTTDASDWYPTNASGRLNSVYKIQRDATYDYIKIVLHNWKCDEHNFSFVSVDDAVKSVDMTFGDGDGDTNGRMITDFDYVSYIDKTVMVV